MPPTETLHHVNNLPTRILSAGDGPALVWFHGVAPVGEWLPVHEMLAKHFTVILPEHPGFGRTERPEWLEGMDDLVLHYDELFRLLWLKQPFLVGFSLGGWMAAEFAVTYPDRIKALALVNAAGLHLDGHLIPDLPALAGRQLAETVFHDPQMAVAYFTREQDPDAVIRHYRGMTTLALLAWNPWFNPKLTRRLRRVGAPALALWAEHDRLIPPAYGEAYRDALPNCRLEILPGCGHMALIEKPEAVAGALERFLGSIQE